MITKVCLFSFVVFPFFYFIGLVVCVLSLSTLGVSYLLSTFCGRLVRFKFECFVRFGCCCFSLSMTISGWLSSLNTLIQMSAISSLLGEHLLSFQRFHFVCSVRFPPVHTHEHTQTHTQTALWLLGEAAGCFHSHSQFNSSAFHQTFNNLLSMAAAAVCNLGLVVVDLLEGVLHTQSVGFYTFA